ncbi:MAG: AAA family ATPase, partial [Pseudomonadota bacterium]
MLRRHFEILARRKRLIFSGAGFGLLIAIAYAAFVPPTFEATVRLHIIGHQIVSDAARADGSPFARRAPSKADLATEHRLLKSRVVAVATANTLNQRRVARVRSRLRGLATGLAQDVVTDVATEAWRFPLFGGGHARVAPPDADAIFERVEIRPVKGSRLVDVVFADADAWRAQTIADAYAGAFLDLKRQQHVSATEMLRRNAEARIERLNGAIETARAKLAQFVDARQLDLTEDGELASGRVRDRTERKLADVERARLMLGPTANAKSAHGIARRANGTVVHRLERLMAKRAELEAEYASRRDRFKPRYPAMVALRRKIDGLDRQIGVANRQLRQEAQSHEEALAAQASDLRAEIERHARRASPTHPDAVRFKALRGQLVQLVDARDQQASLRQQLMPHGETAIAPVEIVAPAAVPSKNSGHDLPRLLLLGFVFGVGGAIGTAYMLEFADDRVRTCDDLAHASGAPCLARLPEMASEAAFASALRNPGSPLSEAHRALAAALQGAAHHGMPRAIAVTSPGSGDGKTATAMGLARHFAAAKLNVLLVDADLRKSAEAAPRVVRSPTGLAALLTTEATLRDVCLATDLPYLTYLPAGVSRHHPASALASPKLHHAIGQALETCDLVIIDGPPVLELADMPLIARA